MDEHERKHPPNYRNEWKNEFDENGYVGLQCASVKEFKFDYCPVSKAVIL